MGCPFVLALLLSCSIPLQEIRGSSFGLAFQIEEETKLVPTDERDEAR
jgi:hypothetical protein